MCISTKEESIIIYSHTLTLIKKAMTYFLFHRNHLITGCDFLWLLAVSKLFKSSLKWVIIKHFPKNVRQLSSPFQRGIPPLFLCALFIVPKIGVLICHSMSEIQVRQSGIGASIRLWFYRVGTVKMSVGGEGSVCYVQVLLKNDCHSDSSMEWSRVSSSFLS